MAGRVPLCPLDTGESFGNREVIVYGSYGDGQPAAAQLSDTDAPHFLITGGSGSDRNALVRNLAIGGARLGCDVRICDPGQYAMRGLCGWPGISMIETGPLRMIQMIDGAYNDMLARYRDLEEDLDREDGLQRIMLVIADYPLLLAHIRALRTELRGSFPGAQAAEHPVLKKFRALLYLSRGAKINLFAASARCSADLFPAEILDQFGGRIALGRQTAEGARLMFGDASVGRGVPVGGPDAGIAATADGPKGVTIGWLPDPLHYPGGFSPAGGDADWQGSLLLSMLPEGATWHGPALMPLTDA